MNLLQKFMAECNRQVRPVMQEEFRLNGSVFFGTFSDPNMVPDTVRQGYDDMIVYEMKAPAVQFASPPEDKCSLTRLANDVEYWIQMVDRKAPVVYTFILTDRAP